MTETIECPFNIGSDLEKAAVREGWTVFDCDGSENGRWQIQGFDTPEDWADRTGEVPPKISDRDAWMKVMKGDGEHHIAAREFIKTANPQEYEAMVQITK